MAPRPLPLPLPPLSITRFTGHTATHTCVRFACVRDCMCPCPLHSSRVSIDGIECVGSPARVVLTSSTPELSMSDLSGAGIRSAVVGEVASIRIAFVDQFNNTATPSPSMQFGMAFLKDREKLTAAAASHEFEGEWDSNSSGVYWMRYKPGVAGPFSFHIWCSPNSAKDERIPFPGSPFALLVSAGQASAAVSVVEGYTKIVKDEKQSLGANAKLAPSAIIDANQVYAGDTLSIKPQIYDDFGNFTTLEDGMLSMTMTRPNGVGERMNYTTKADRGGVTTYELRHDPTTAGSYAVHVSIAGKPIKGSPVLLEVHPDRPEPPLCKLAPPTGGPLYAGKDLAERVHITVLKTYDRFGNACSVGGLVVTARLQLVKQGVHDQAALMPANHLLEVEDLGNGTYHIKVSATIPCMLKMVVNLDKNLPTQLAELSPVSLHIVAPPEDSAAPPTPKPAPTEPAPPIRDPTPAAAAAAATAMGGGAKGDGGRKLKQAGNEMMLGFGAPEERRQKDSLVMAAEAFADGSDTFAFDQGEPTGGALHATSSHNSVNALSSIDSASSSSSHRRPKKSTMLFDR